MAREFRDADDWDRMARIPAPVGAGFYDQLMACVTQSSPDPLSTPVVNAVQHCIKKLDDKDRWVLEAMYVWGVSYADLADMMGYRSKASSHGAVKQAEQNLRAHLEINPVIIRLRDKERYSKMPESWADASWEKLRSIEKQASTVEIDGSITPRLESYFDAMGVAVRTSAPHDDLYSLCRNVATLAASALGATNKWDIESMQDTLCAKQHDYGHENINAFGIIGVTVRLSDKIARYNNLVGKASNKVSGETILDTLVDMVGYGVISMMLEDGSFQLPLTVEEDPF